MQGRTRRAFGAVALAVCLAAFAVSSASADDAAAPIYAAPDIGGGQFLNETPNTWFVELSGSADAFRAEAKAHGVAYSERFEYQRLWKGVSIRAAEKQLTKITNFDSVKAVYPVYTFKVPETATVSPDLATAIHMTGASTTHDELGYTGAGVKVAVMDTGIDYDHADLGGDGTQRSDSATFPTSRVIAGWDFVGDAFNADSTSPAFNPNVVPDARPDDCQGHGTHVAGIVGANGTTKGVAPDVKFGAYRVFGCDGSTTADIMLAAMERAEADGMQVLNMSIGSAFMTWPQYPTAEGADALASRGMIVVASIGNSGANGVYSAGAPGVGNNVIGVASFDNSHVSALTFRTNPANTQMAYLQISNSQEAPTSGTTPEVVYVGRGCPQSGPSWNLPQADPYLADPAGKVALIDRGICTFDSKYQRAFSAGAVAVVVANNVAGPFSGGGIVNKGIPAVGITQTDGNTLKSQLSAGPVTLTWTSERVNTANATGGTASSFTSYGLTAELKLKPNIGAPGGLIRAPYPLEKGAYAILSGTSMASPHVAGAAALLLQAKPGTTPAQAKVLFQNSADPVPFQANRNFLETVHRQGAGMVDIDDAIEATATVTPSELSLGEGTGGTATLTITNRGSADVTYTLGNQAALSTGGATNAPGLFLGHAAAAFGAPSVTVPANGSATVDVTITAAVSQGRQYGGYIRLTGSDGSVLRVPYAGFSGDYQAVRVLTPTSFEFPWLAKLSGGSFLKQEAGATYTLTGGDVPYFLLHFEHQARKLELKLLDAAGREVAGRGLVPVVYKEAYLRRNSTATAFFAYAWDGKQRQNGRGGATWVDAPDGTYQMRVSVLKALGDEADASHWETWTSPTFTIDRP